MTAGKTAFFVRDMRKGSADVSNKEFTPLTLETAVSRQ